MILTADLLKHVKAGLIRLRLPVAEVALLLMQADFSNYFLHAVSVYHLLLILGRTEAFFNPAKLRATCRIAAADIQLRFNVILSQRSKSL